MDRVRVRQLTKRGRNRLRLMERSKEYAVKVKRARVILLAEPGRTTSDIATSSGYTVH